ncbi:hypothetical protein JWS13_30440 [Rhodococcus pseudokoreensis]|uniref:Uncharacterized protein n=1 Tax=Rhodococcus pseudokoreensis TaxID=2811421 RepID=A0A974ZWH4_9NOCA|nr:hypothetical protein [Rhodococcus pseudokoreensis]QSE92621.1 hypothetical protein JWS13_30440 [Rhodococcus pseudokoreensis]
MFDQTTADLAMTGAHLTTAGTMLTVLAIVWLDHPGHGLTGAGLTVLGGALIAIGSLTVALAGPLTYYGTRPGSPRSAPEPRIRPSRHVPGGWQ